MAEGHLLPADAFPWLQVHQKCVTAANAFLVYLEPTEGVWWQQMSYFC